MGNLRATQDFRYGAVLRLVVALLLSLVLHSLVFLSGFWGGGEGGNRKGGAQVQKLSVVVKGAPDASAFGGATKMIEEVVREEGGNDQGGVEQSSPNGFGEERGEKKWGRDSVNDPGGQEYFTDQQLTKRPYPLTVLEDFVSDRLGEVRLDGRAVLKVWISAQGQVDDIAMIYNDMPVPVYEETVTAYRQMRFSPAEIAGRAVACVIAIEVSFEDFRLKIGD